ncbi:MAG: DUF4190 domain-containing protein [Mariniblastus sp.]
MPPNLTACPYCNAQFQAAPPQMGQQPAANQPPLQPGVASPYQAPMYRGQQPKPTQHGEGDATGGVIPYKNPKALVAYYLGILSGLPLIGFPLGIAAFVLGILGLRDRKKNPAIKGSVHAGIGIGCGGLFAVLWGLGLVAIVIALMSER